MTKYFFLFIIFIFSCKQSPIEKDIISNYGDNLYPTMTLQNWKKLNNSFENATEDGYSMTFYKKKISSEGLQVNGRKNGIWIEYYENGNVKSIVGYWNGMPEGIWKTYYSNGVLEEEGYHFRPEKPEYEVVKEYDIELKDTLWITNILNDTIYRHGIWNKYDSLGNLDQSITYFKGKIIQ